MKYRFSAALLLFGLLPLLFGCSGGTKEAAEPPLLWFNNGDGEYIINSAGQVVTPPAEDSFNSSVLYDASGTGRYAVQFEENDSDTELAEWGEPLVESIHYSFFDARGEQVGDVSIDGQQIPLYYYTNGDISTVRFLVETNDGGPGWRIYDLSGRLLVEDKLEVPASYTYCYVSMNQNGRAMYVSCHAGPPQDLSPEYYHVYLYTLSGEPLELPKQYNGIDWTYEYLPDGSKVIGQDYLCAYYATADGGTLHDLLTSDGRLVLEGLSQIYDINGEAVVCTKDGVRGLLSFDGEWIYQEPASDEPQEGSGAARPADADATLQLKQIYDGLNKVRIENSYGKLILAGQEYGKARVLDGAWDGQDVAVQIEETQDAANVAGTRVRFLDAWGEPLRDATINETVPVELAYYYGCGVDTVRFIAANAAGPGWHIYDSFGNLLVDERLDVPEDYTDRYAGLYQNGRLLFVNYHAAPPESYDLQFDQGYVYTLNGEPVELARQYNVFSRMYRYLPNGSVGSSELIDAAYTAASGAPLHDILAADGSVLLEGLSEVGTVAGDAVICYKGDVCGLLSFDGEWLYQTPVSGEPQPLYGAPQR